MEVIVSVVLTLDDFELVPIYFCAGLVDKPHNSSVVFRPKTSGDQIFVGTGHQKFRLYDTRQRRPALECSFRDAGITALAADNDGALSH